MSSAPQPSQAATRHEAGTSVPPSLLLEPDAQTPAWQDGVVARLNKAAEFGYVLAEDGQRYIFVFGYALKRADGGRLNVGQAVRFQLDPQGRVLSLHSVHCKVR